MPPALVAKLERWLLELSPQRPIMHAEHAGSMLRGAFGHALKAIACRCPLERHRPACVYQQIFEPQPPADWPSRYRDCPPAFVLTPPPAHAGAHRDLHFAVTLLGPAVTHSELVWAAWLQAAQSGLGGARIPAGIRRAQLLTQAPPQTQRPPLCLRFTSPLLLKRKHSGDRSSRPLGPHQITPADLFIALHRRMELTRQLYGVPAVPLPPLEHWLALAAQCRLLDRLQEIHFARRSNRQQQRMPLYGLCGDLVLLGPLDHDLLAALTLGQWLHIGGKTALGQGGYSLLPASCSTFNEGTSP